jgi:anti-sigma B factor antagonist
MVQDASSAYVVVDEVESDDRHVVVRVRGALDMASRTPVVEALRSAVASAPSVTIDLGELTFCDSGGMAMLVGVHNEAGRHGSAVTIRNVPPSIQQRFGVAGVGALLAGPEGEGSRELRSAVRVMCECGGQLGLLSVPYEGGDYALQAVCPGCGTRYRRVISELTARAEPGRTVVVRLPRTRPRG